jgi:hypothetical protein
MLFTERKFHRQSPSNQNRQKFHAMRHRQQGARAIVARRIDFVEGEISNEQYGRHDRLRRGRYVLKERSKAPEPARNYAKPGNQIAVQYAESTSIAAETRRTRLRER